MGHEALRGVFRWTIGAWVVWNALALPGCGASRPGEEVAQTASGLSGEVSVTRGLLRDDLGTPLAGARVELRVAGSHRAVARDRTAADGTFALRARPGTYDILVTPRRPFAPQRFPGQAIGGGLRLDLVLVAVFDLNLAGHVRDQHGQPLAGLRVCVLPTCATTDAAGAFALSGQASHANSTSLTISGTISGSSFGVNATIDPERGRDLDIALPLLDLAGTLLDTAGNPEPGRSIFGTSSCVTFTQGDISGNYCLPPVQTDQAGHFQLKVFPGVVPLLVNDSLGTFFITESVTHDATVTIQVPAQQHLGGRVVDRNGNGVGMQSVCLSYDACQAKNCVGSCALTDDSGRYDLDAFAGDYRLFFGDGFQTPVGQYSVSKLFTLSAPSEVDLALANRTLTGTVLEPDGTPASGAAVSGFCYPVSIDGFDGQGCTGGMTVDASGRFAFALPAPGDVDLPITGPTSSTLVPVSVSEDTDIVVTLPNVEEATGQVLAADGTTIAGARVCFSEESPFIFQCVTTDAAGQYQVSLSPGAYSVFTDAAAGDLGTPGPVDVLSAPLSIQFGATLPISAQLFGSDGSPAAGVPVDAGCGVVTLPDGDFEEFSCRADPSTDDAGRFTITAQLDSSVTLQFGPAASTSLLAVTVLDVDVGDGDVEVALAVQTLTPGARPPGRGR